GLTVHPIGASSVYRNDSGTDDTTRGAETTTYEYYWGYANGVIPETIIITSPTVEENQNGTGSLEVMFSVNDSYGRFAWRTDSLGATTYLSYDTATGAIDRTEVVGSGVDLLTVCDVDSQGRTTVMIDPKGNKTYTVFDDLHHEVRSVVGSSSEGDIAPATG